QALLELCAKEKKVSLMSLFGINMPVEITVNGVIGFLPVERSVQKAKQVISEGFKTIKIKTGRDDFEHDYRVISEIRNAVGDEIIIRTDTNGKWSLPDAIKNLNRLEPLQIEYAEQPVNSLEEFIELKKETDIPL